MGIVTVNGGCQPGWIVLEPEIPAPLMIIVHAGAGEMFVDMVTEISVSLINLKSTISMSPRYSTNAVPWIIFMVVNAHVNTAEEATSVTAKTATAQRGRLFPTLFSPPFSF